MEEGFTTTGEWWLPDKPDQKVSGTLSYDPFKGLELCLNDSLCTHSDTDDSRHPVLILGVTHDVGIVTVYQCANVGGRGSAIALDRKQWYRLKSENYIPQYAFLGVHFSTIAEVKFEQFSVDYLYLSDWADISGFERETNDNPDEILVRYVTPDPIKVNVGDEFSFGIHIYASKKDVQQGVQIKQEMRVVVTTETEKEFGWFLEVLDQIKRFLTLGVMLPVEYTSITGIKRFEASSLENSSEYSSCKILFRKSDFCASPARIHPLKIIFSYNDISSDFASIVNNWFLKAKDLQPAINLYFATVFNPYLYIENRFLSLTQAIEAYHRRTMGGHEIPQEEHLKRRDLILKSTPEEYRGWLDGKLTYSNEQNLRNRLKDLIDEDSATTMIFLKNKKERSKFAHEVTTNRNGLIHNDPNSKFVPPSNEKLLELSNKLDILLYTRFLKELGLSHEKIAECTEKITRYKMVKYVKFS